MHGTVNGYTNGGCRCESWSAAMTEKKRRWRAGIAGRPIPESLHGTAGCYINRGCRCEPCRVANTEAMRAYRERRRGEAAIR